jgi:hypothetical protein
MTFADYVRVLRRFVWLVLALTLAGANFALGLLIVPPARYEAKFSVALAPNAAVPSSQVGNVIDALDRRSVPSTFAQVVTSPTTKDLAASNAHLSRSGLSVNAGVVADSNVIEATVTGQNRNRTRDYAAALLSASTLAFNHLYSQYSVTPLRVPTSTATVSRHLAAGVVLGALAGAVLGFLIALAIDASRRPRAVISAAPNTSSTSTGRRLPQ